MKESGFAIRHFDNRNGVISWRVDGLLQGVRVRRNFKTREEAIAEKSVLELKNVQLAAGMRPLLTTLAEPQLREAEAAFARLLNTTSRALRLSINRAGFASTMGRVRVKISPCDFA